MKRLEDAIQAIILMAVLSTVGLGLLTVVAELVPDPVQTESCTCAGKPDCHTKVFQVDDDRQAFCAFYGKRQSCCIVESR